MKKVLLFTVLIFAFAAQANSKETEEGGGKIVNEKNAVMTTVTLEFIRYTQPCKFDYTISGYTYTITHDKDGRDGPIIVYYDVTSPTLAVINNFRDLNGKPFKNVSIAGNYGCNNQSSIPGGFQFTLLPNSIQNGIFIISLSY